MAVGEMKLPNVLTGLLPVLPLIQPAPSPQRFQHIRKAKHHLNKSKCKDHIVQITSLFTISLVV